MVQVEEGNGQWGQEGEGSEEGTKKMGGGSGQWGQETGGGAEEETGSEGGGGYVTSIPAATRELQRHLLKGPLGSALPPPSLSLHSTLTLSLLDDRREGGR